MVEDPYDLMARAVLVIRQDPNLRDCFNRVLQMGASTQQVRVHLLLQELDRMGAPEVVRSFVSLLANDKLAHQVLVEINK